MSIFNLAPERSRRVVRSVGLAIALFCIPLLIAIAIIAFFHFSPLGADYVPQLVSLLVAAIFALAPLLACFVQTISIERQSSKLDSTIIPAVKETQYFQLALASLKSIRPASVNEPDFRLPILLFATIITFCSLISFMGLFWPTYLQQPTVILDGLHTITNSSIDEITKYQSGTLVVSAVAFLGAYLALFKRLLDQLNNNDIYPISFHYYSVWLIGSMIIAAIMRHVVSIFGVAADDSSSLVILGFAIGAAPAPFFTAFVHWAFKHLNITGDKDDPDPTNMPSNLNLLMIDGLANDKIDRLSELDITDAQVLSCQNPLTLWVRLPYDLGLIVDWISQAQLYVCLREEGLRKARAQQITDVHKFVSVLSDAAASADLCTELGLKPAFVGPLLKSLAENPCFARLREVKAAMIGIAPGDQNKP